MKTIVIITIIGTVLIIIRLFFQFPKLAKDSIISFKVLFDTISVYNLKLLFFVCLLLINVHIVSKNMISEETMYVISIFLLIYSLTFMRITIKKQD